MTAPLDRLALAYGLGSPHQGEDGGLPQVPDSTKRLLLAAFGADASTDEAVAAALDAAEGRPIPVLKATTDSRCFLPDALEHGRAWGISAQLYELRSARNWGIGDFADLAEFCHLAAGAGADFVGINPLHALFLADPARRSPFSPSNRAFLNPLYIAVDRVPGFKPGDAPAGLGALRAADAVDYPAVAQAKRAALRAIYKRAAPLRDAQLDAFRAEGGEALHGHALFEALSEAMAAVGHGAGWTGWPLAFRDIGSAEVAAFAKENAEAVDFHVWLQWLAQTQLSEAAKAARAVMRIGLYLDFAVGEAPDGSATWSAPGLFVKGMNIGAPPDVFSANGQDWTLAARSPQAMEATGFADFGRIMSAMMRDAGALRLDHAMSLWQLFLLPSGASAADGGYIRYRIEALLTILADLSHQHRSIIIGEDLGWVPAGFREVMRDSGILAYRILYFEQDHGYFIAPGDYPRLAMACLSTHDLAPLKGWWRGDDVAMRAQYGLIDEQAAASQQATRVVERDAFIGALVFAGLLSDSQAQLHRGGIEGAAELPEAICLAAHRYVSRTACVLATARLADMVGEERPTNLPGTTEEYPNWRLKLDVPLEALSGHRLFIAIAAAMAAERPDSP